MTIAEHAASILAFLLETGWTHADVFAAPRCVLSDWCSDRGKDQWACELAEEFPTVLIYLRDATYLSAPPDQMPAIRRHTRRMVEAMKSW